MHKLAPTYFILPALLFIAACETSDHATYWNAERAAEEGETGESVVDENGSEAAPPPAPSGSKLDDLSGVVFLHADVSGWPVTSNLRSVNVSGGNISLPYDKANTWPGVNIGSAIVNANPWVIVNLDGVWYAATWEWLRVGQTSKSASAVHGSHIKKAPLNNFVPQSGEVYGFMVSGLARDSRRNVQERTNVVMYRWP